MKRTYAVIAAVLIGLAVTSATVEQPAVAKAKEGLESKVIRLHIIANSDSEEDQELKLKVRDQVLENSGRGFLKKTPSPISRDELEASLREDLQDIEEKAQVTVLEQGYDYPVEVRLETVPFPTKTYGDVTFPEGDYLALRIIIGEGKGHNWWCSLYPSLCFIDATHPVVDGKGKEELEATLTEEEQQLVTLKTDFRFDFRLRKYLRR